MYPFRIFISYSHEDTEVANKVVKVLQKMGLEPVWDKNIRPGMPFTDSIKSLISHAHIFMPLVTENSQKRPWIHQEIGFAMALNIPVLPIAIGQIPGEMIGQLQAISVQADLHDLKKRLDEANIEGLVVPSPTELHIGTVVAELPETRTELIAQYTNWLKEQRKICKLRYRGALSAFCIPNVDIHAAIWRRRDGNNPRSDHYHILQREERRALEMHTRECGCSLIINPYIDYRARGPECTITHLSILVEFLESVDDRVQVMTTEHAGEGSLLIMGDWFEANSIVPRNDGYRQTIFSWHAPTVLRSIYNFDRQFEELVQRSGRDVKESRTAAITEIKSIIDGLPKTCNT